MDLGTVSRTRDHYHRFVHRSMSAEDVGRGTLEPVIGLILNVTSAIGKGTMRVIVEYRNQDH